MCIFNLNYFSYLGWIIFLDIHSLNFDLIHMSIIQYYPFMYARASVEPPVMEIVIPLENRAV
jgi:hypothetical protein